MDPGVKNICVLLKTYNIIHEISYDEDIVLEKIACLNLILLCNSVSKMINFYKYTIV